MLLVIDNSLGELSLVPRIDDLDVIFNRAISLNVIFVLGYFSFGDVERWSFNVLCMIKDGRGSRLLILSERFVSLLRVMWTCVNHVSAYKCIEVQE